MKQIQINIFTVDLVWMGAIDAVYSFVHRSSWHEIATSELRISKTAQGIEEMKIGRILVVNNQTEKTLIIEDMTTTLTDSYWTFTLLPLKGMLNYRIVHPFDSGGVVGGAPWVQRTQSQVMTWIANDNLITQTRDPDRKFLDSTNTKNMFQIATTKIYGSTIDYKVDWTTGYMGDAIVSVAKMYSAGKYPIGWNIYISAAWDSFEMDTYEAIDKTIHQADRPPVVFSEDFGNIKNANYTYSIKDWRNVVYMTWNNGTTDQNTPVGNTANGATRNFNRKEIIINSSKKTDIEIYNEGKSELNKRPHIESFTAEIVNNKNTLSTYGVDWDLGDVVTIQSKALKKDQLITVDAQITQIEEIYDQGEYSINATFGEGKLSLIQLIKNAINQK